jgi:hypothetical protein
MNNLQILLKCYILLIMLYFINCKKIQPYNIPSQIIKPIDTWAEKIYNERKNNNDNYNIEKNKNLYK